VSSHFALLAVASEYGLDDLADILRTNTGSSKKTKAVSHSNRSPKEQKGVVSCQDA
jgi:hypothetical protein